jgi:hypothetical protein
MKLSNLASGLFRSKVTQMKMLKKYFLGKTFQLEAEDIWNDHHPFIVHIQDVRQNHRPTFYVKYSFPMGEHGLRIDDMERSLRRMVGDYFNCDITIVSK